MRILLIDHYMGSEKLGMEFRPYYLCKEWARIGYEPTTIGGSYSHLRKSQPRKLGWESENGIDFLWLWTNKYKGNGILRLISMLIFVVQLLLLAPYIALRVKPHFIIASSTYPLDIFPSWLIAKLSGARLIFEIHDLWPLSPMELGGYSKKHPFIMLMRFGEWFAYKFSDKIISILPNSYEHVKKDGVPKEKWAHIPNGVSLNAGKPEQLPQYLSDTIEQLREDGFSLIGYAGSIGPANVMHTMIEAAQILKDEKIAFLIVGDGSSRKMIEDMAHSLNLKNVYFFGYLLKNQIPAFLSEMDILTYCGKKSKLYKYGISLNKTFEYMLAAKPIVQAFSAANDVVTEAKCGVTVEAENPPKFADAILKIANLDESTLHKMGAAGKAYVLEHHNFTALAKNFFDAMDDHKN